MPDLPNWLWITLGVLNLPVYLFWIWVICTDSEGRSELDISVSSILSALIPTHTSLLSFSHYFYGLALNEIAFRVFCILVASAGCVIGEAYLVEWLFF